MHPSVRLFIACLTGMAVASLTVAVDGQDQAAQDMGLLKYVRPQFPAVAEDQGLVQGFATIAVAWQGDGRPSDVVVLRTSERLLGESARDAAMQWRRAPSPIVREVAIYELKFVLSGVIVCRNTSAEAQLAESRAIEVPPLHLPSAEELDSPLKAIKQPMPEFPVAARGKWDEGTVVVEFYVDEDGRVRAPTVRESTAAEFSSEALSAIQQWQFETPRKNGQPAVMAGRWEFQFHRTT
jgi:TonB family protein